MQHYTKIRNFLGSYSQWARIFPVYRVNDQWLTKFVSLWFKEILMSSSGKAMHLGIISEVSRASFVISYCLASSHEPPSALLCL